MNQKVIDYQYKILYALGMIFIVQFHTGGGGVNIFNDWFRAFHLGLFMFVSGYFYNYDNENHVVSFIKKKIIHLLIPLYVWNFIYGIFVLALKHYGGFSIGGNFNLYNLVIAPMQNGQHFAYNLSCWFLAPLIMVHIYNVVLRKFLRKIWSDGVNEWAFWLLNFALGLIAVYLSQAGYNHGAYLPFLRMMFFIPFYETGILYKNHLKKYDNLDSLIYFSAIFIISLILIYFYKSVPYSNAAWLQFKQYPLYIPFIEGGLGIAFWLRISKILLPAIGKSRYLNLIADNTWAIMMHQFIGFMLVKLIFYGLYLYTPLCQNFSVQKFKTDKWYYYLPHQDMHMLIIYAAAGIVVPIVIQYILDRIKMRFSLSFFNK